MQLVALRKLSSPIKEVFRQAPWPSDKNGAGRVCAALEEVGKDGL